MMKFLVLIIACIIYTAKSCASGDCNSCSDKTACVGVASNACAWNYGDSSCDENPNIIISTNCSIFNNLQKACQNTSDCGTYNTNTGVCSDTDITTGNTSCTDYDNYQTECEALSGSTCYYKKSTNTCVPKLCINIDDEDDCHDIGVGDQDSTVTYDTGCGYNSGSCRPLRPFVDCLSYTGYQIVCRSKSSCTYSTIGNCITTSNLVWGGIIDGQSSTTDNCSDLRNVPEACNSVSTPNGDHNNGCEYKRSQFNCVPIQNYNDCSEYNGLPIACAAESSCGTYKWDDGTCSNNDVTTGMTLCTDFDNYKNECENLGGKTCHYNNSSNTCVLKTCNQITDEDDCNAILPGNQDSSVLSDRGCEWTTSCQDRPALASNCSNLNGFPLTCNLEGTCVLSSDGNTCGTAAELVWSHSNITSCNDLNMYPSECEDVINPNGDYGEGCEFNGSTCEAVPVWYSCADLNNYIDLCEAESQCAYNYASSSCVKTSNVPSHTSGSVSDCSVLDGFKVACDALAAVTGNGPNNRGCSFAKSDSGCDQTPQYIDNCSVFNDYEDACTNQAECQIARDRSRCEATTVSGAITCSSLNNDENACNNVEKGSGKGANSLGCAFNSQTPGCVDVTAFVDGVTTCASLNYIQKSCEAEASCQFTDEKICISTKKQESNEKEKEQNQNQNASHLTVSAVLAIFLILLI